MARYVLSDPHGNRKTFRKVLQTIRFSTDDLLIVNGDIPDRGPDTKGIVDDILELRRRGFNIIAKKGNHEDFLLLGDNPYIFDSWMHNGGVQTLNSYGIEVKAKLAPDYSIEYEYIPNYKDLIPKDHMEFYESLTTTLELDNFIFVHAGLDFYANDPVEDTDDSVKMWERYFTYNPAKVQNRILITGHTPRNKDEINRSIEQVKQNGYGHIIIDNGCFQGLKNKDQYDRGSLCCLNIDTLEVVYEKNID